MNHNLEAQLNIAPRSFNIVELDEMKGILTKTSTHKKELIAEIFWYLKIPKQLQYLTPRIFDYSSDDKSPFVQMEFYGYRTLHEILLSGTKTGGDYRKIFQQLLFVFKELQTCRIECDRSAAQNAIRSMCVEKTLRRLNKLRQDENFKKFFTQKIVVNGKIFHSLSEILVLLPLAVERMLFENAEKYFSVIHGDLCLPNILVEESRNFIRLVDPRGQFGDFDIYGDWRYDLAKLLHSLEGGYDFIIRDEFNLSVRGTTIDYEITADFAEARENFFDVFASQLAENLTAVRLIESTLFLSMIPLHSNSLSRQQIMLATGVELFEAVLADIQKNSEGTR